MSLCMRLILSVIAVASGFIQVALADGKSLPPLYVDIQGICSRQLIAFNLPKTDILETAKNEKVILDDINLKLDDHDDLFRATALLRLRQILDHKPLFKNEYDFRKSRFWSIAKAYFDESELTRYNCKTIADLHDNLNNKAKYIVGEILKNHKGYLKTPTNQDYLWAMDYFMRRLWLIIDYQRVVQRVNMTTWYKMDELRESFQSACQCGRTEQFCRVWRLPVTQPSFKSMTQEMRDSVNNCDKGALDMVRAYRSALAAGEDGVALAAARCFLVKLNIIDSTVKIDSMKDVQTYIKVIVDKKVQEIKGIMSTFKAPEKANTGNEDAKIKVLHQISAVMDQLRQILVPPFDVMQMTLHKRDYVEAKSALGMISTMELQAGQETVVQPRHYHVVAAEVCEMAHHTFSPKK